MERNMSREAGSRFAGKKLLFISATILLLAASCRQGGVNNNGQQATSTSENNQNLPQGEKNGWNTYTSPTRYGFTIQYPNDFGFNTDPQKAKQIANTFIPVCDDTSVACVFYAKDKYPSTNFDGAGVSVNILSDSDTEANCKMPRDGEQQSGTQTINGVVYQAYQGSAGATGHIENYKKYRTFHNSLCYELVQRVSQTNIDNYPKGTVKEFNANEVWSKLGQVLSTFKFTDGSQGSSTGSMPKMTFKLLGSQCVQNSEYSRFALYADGNQAATVQSALCEVSKVVFLKGNSDVVYFEIVPSGLGGYYSYTPTYNLYKLDLVKKTATKIDTGDYWMSGIDFNADLSKVIYAPDEYDDLTIGVTVQDLVNGTKQTYPPVPAKGEQRTQIGNVKFSPDYSKAALAVAFGPDKEYGEVYVLDLATSKYSLYKRTTSGHVQVNGWKNNNEVDWSSIP